MKIYSCLVVKNEVDIIEFTIENALKWSDKIIILDNGSTDGTFDKILSLMKEHDRVTFWGRYEGPFRDSIRAIVYNDYRHELNDGDWWCRLDSDEVYIDDPRLFLNECKSGVDHVYSASFQYYYTDTMIKREREDKEYLNEPFYKRLKYYLCDWSEIRFIKHTNNTLWPLNFSNPIILLNPDDRRIKLKHYQYRTSTQMMERYEVRSKKGNVHLFSHENKKNRIWMEEELILDVGVYEYDELKLPNMKKTSYLSRLILRALLSLLKMKKVNRFFMASKEFL